MTIRTPLCDMLGIEYPIMLAGMGGVSYGELAAAVSEAGGFGTLGMAGRSQAEIKDEIKKVRWGRRHARDARTGTLHCAHDDIGGAQSFPGRGVAKATIHDGYLWARHIVVDRAE